MNMKQKIEKLTFDSTQAKFGKGLFETIKIKEGTPLLLEEHLERLFTSIKELGFDGFKNSISKKDLKKEILEACKDRDGQALRVAVCDEGYNFSFRNIQYESSHYREGFKVAVSPVKRGYSPLLYHKTSNYFENIYSLENAREKGCQESLFVNLEGRVLEGSLSNIFFIKDNELYTPSLKDSLLPGIMRNKVIEATRELGLSLYERGILYEEIGDFAFAFLTNSLVELIKITHIEGSGYTVSSSEGGRQSISNCEASDMFEKINCKVKELIYDGKF